MGISSDSVVHDRAALARRVTHVLSHYRQPALVEQYIEGREIYVSMLGRPERARAADLPVLRDRLLAHAGRSAAHRVLRGQVGRGLGRVHRHEARPLREPHAGARRRASRPVALARVRGDGGARLRAHRHPPPDDGADAGTPYVIDVNPNCDLSDERGRLREGRARPRAWDMMRSFAHRRARPRKAPPCGHDSSAPDRAPRVALSFESSAGASKRATPSPAFRPPRGSCAIDCRGAARVRARGARLPGLCHLFEVEVLAVLKDLDEGRSRAVGRGSRSRLSSSLWARAARAVARRVPLRRRRGPRLGEVSVVDTSPRATRRRRRSTKTRSPSRCARGSSRRACSRPSTRASRAEPRRGCASRVVTEGAEVADKGVARARVHLRIESRPSRRAGRASRNGSTARESNRTRRATREGQNRRRTPAATRTRPVARAWQRSSCASRATC